MRYKNIYKHEMAIDKLINIIFNKAINTKTLSHQDVRYHNIYKHEMAIIKSIMGKSQKRKRHEWKSNLENSQYKISSTKNQAIEIK